jgi:protein-disulfide isomerase
MRTLIFALLFSCTLVSQATAQTKAAFSLPPRASGSKDAALVMEVFSDFECPHCGELYTKVLTRVIEEYCDKGKLYLIHHDYPLPQHRFAPDAARWANAAAVAGKYEIVAAALFEQQAVWPATGEIEKVIAAALSPTDFKKTKQVYTEHKDALDSAIQNGLFLGHQNNVTHTPTTKITYKGNVVSVTEGIVGYSILKRFLDDQLAK